jgi:putative tryptophan/tyrosine transport system substrate-binding protein
VPAVSQGLEAAGFAAARNVVVEYRWARDYGELPDLAEDLVRHNPTVIITDGTPATLAARGASQTIPVVFMIGRDPVELGLVGAINRPDNNLTGFMMFNDLLTTKRVELLHEIVPTATIVGLLFNQHKDLEQQTRRAEDGARAIGLQLRALKASTEAEIDAAFDALVQSGISALIVYPDPFLDSRRDRLVALAARHSIAAAFEWREFAESGALVSYGVNISDVYRRTGGYAGRILQGAKPADLPIEQPTKFELVINLRTAKALGLTIPPTLLARADEVIE